VSEHILVADDDPKQAALVRLYLERDGFDVTLSVTSRGVALRPPTPSRADRARRDDARGRRLEVCRQLGGDDGIPRRLLTARSTENDILLGLYLAPTTT